ncbi:MAG: hypothetical protein WAN35_19095 [Terracidiphilus sp.]
MTTKNVPAHESHLLVLLARADELFSPLEPLRWAFTCRLKEQS